MSSAPQPSIMRWADYEDEPDYIKYTLPTIPWAPHILPVSIKSNTDDTNNWVTVKSKKKK